MMYYMRCQSRSVRIFFTKSIQDLKIVLIKKHCFRIVYLACKVKDVWSYQAGASVRTVDGKHEAVDCRG